MKVQREWLLIILGVFILLGITCGPVQAKLNYPTKTVEMVVAYPAGGGQDVAFRILAKHADKFMGQKIVVINKMGGGGVIGNTEIASRNPTDIPSALFLPISPVMNSRLKVFPTASRILSPWS